MAPLLRVYGALLLVQLLFGLHYLTTQLVVERINPVEWAAVRISVAGTLLVLLHRHNIRHWPVGAEWRQVALLAALGVVVNMVFFAMGMERTTPAHGALIMCMVPVLTLTFAVALGYERASRAQQAALCLALAGALVLLEVDRFRLTGAYLFGDLLVFINATSFALFLVLSRQAVDRHGAMGLTALVMGGSAVAMAPLALWSGVTHADAWTALPQHVLLAAGYTIILATVVTYSLNYYALGKVPSSQVALFIYLQPLIATSTSIAAERDVLTLRLIISAVLILGGIALTALSYRDESKDSGNPS
jgi:drug/metabolite transporter (DMT)-like permease